MQRAKPARIYLPVLLRSYTRPIGSRMPDLASAPTPLIKASPRNITTVHSVRGWVSMSPANPFLRFPAASHPARSFAHKRL
jgi:hypothetical protein